MTSAAELRSGLSAFVDEEVLAAGIFSAGSAIAASIAGAAGGATLGAGGAMNSLSNSAGTITSAARRSKPDCRAQSPATCSITTEPTITALRLTPPTGAKRSRWDI